MDSTTVITNVRVFDGDAVKPLRTVAVRDGLITDDTDQPGAATVDAHGGVLMPGLIDAHVHIDSRADLDRCARAGVTTVLDMATRDIGALDAPRFVADRVTDGVDYVKVIVEDPRMPGTAALPAATIRAIVAAAHAAGLLVVAHAVTTAALGLATDADVDVVTHAPVNRGLTEPEAATLAVAGAVLVPTLTMMQGTTAAIGAKLTFRMLRSLRIAPPVGFAHARSSVRAAHTAGVTILVGTDANNERGAPYHPVHGTALHDELALLVDAGLSAVEAIRSATVSSAETFGLQDRGVIAAGRRAALVLVDGDPTVDITAVRQVRGVWIGGLRVG